MVTLFDIKSGIEREYPNDSRFRMSSDNHGNLLFLFDRFSDQEVGMLSVEKSFPVCEQHFIAAVTRLNQNLDDWLSVSDSAVCIMPTDLFRCIDWEQVFSDLSQERAVGHSKSVSQEVSYHG